MADTDPIKLRLQTSLNDFCSITKYLLAIKMDAKDYERGRGFPLIHNTLRELLEAVSGDVKHGSAGGSDQQALVLTSVLDRMISQDRNIQKLTETALEMRSRQQEVERVEAELEKRCQEIRELQTRLQDAEKRLETALYHGKQKLESIEKAKKGAVSPETLIQYTHRISQASSAVSPVGWHVNDPRRPYPADSDMICGLLGRLSSGPRSNNAQAGSTTAAGAQKPTILLSDVESKLPPEKKIALAGGPAGLTASKPMPKLTQPPTAVAGGGTFNPFGPGIGMTFTDPQTFTDPETMSEDSSPSSSDEA